MNARSLRALEFQKILLRLAEHTAFPLGRERALRLRPTADEEIIRRRQRETSEARTLLDRGEEIDLGGASDLRPLLKKASIGSVLTPLELLSIRETLVIAGQARRSLLSLRGLFPTLAETASAIEECPLLIQEISRSLNERGEVVDEASPTLARLRGEGQEVQERLLSRLERMVSAPENRPFLQEPIVTQRGGRYVIPLKTDFRGRIPGVVHDQSASGATLFLEPLATVELNNRWRELQLAEEKEVQRILKALAARVAEHKEALEDTLEATASLDLALAKGRYSVAISGREPQFVPFRPSKDSSHPGSTLRLVRARHPLLPSEKVVPIDIQIGEHFFILVITGPNTGGKTVTLKTVGLLALMAQAGLHIPAQEGSLSIFRGIYADIGDEQSIEQSLSTFSSHLTNIVEILRRADEHALVLLDELGAGTDPVEGSALARAILDRLRRRRITSFVATHYSELKGYAHATPGVENASVEFDPETLAPTYEVTIGLPGRSNALAIAARLGLEGEVIEEARGLLSPQDREVEGYLADIREARQEALAAREAVEATKREMEREERELREKLMALEESRRQILNEAHQRARREIQEVRGELRRLGREAREGGAQKKMEAQLSELEEGVRPLPPLPKEGLEEVMVGAKVWVRGLEREGEVVSLEGEQVEVQVGRFRVRAERGDLETGKGLPEAHVPAAITVSPPPLVAPVLDLRGEKAEEALLRLEKYLNDAFLSKVSTVRIIHGKATGTLRRLVRETLKGHPLVASYGPGEEDEGVTIVHLASSD